MEQNGNIFRHEPDEDVNQGLSDFGVIPGISKRLYLTSKMLEQHRDCRIDVDGITGIMCAKKCAS
jgi:hypothetical protein